jgi:hypothetical protein
MDTQHALSRIAEWTHTPQLAQIREAVEAGRELDAIALLRPYDVREPEAVKALVDAAWAHGVVS